MGKKSLASKLKQARALQNAEEDARLEGKEKFKLAADLAEERKRIMRSIRDGIRSGQATTNVSAIDDEIECLDDLTLDPPPPEPQRKLLEKLPWPQ